MFEFPPFRLDPVNQNLWRRQHGSRYERIRLPPTAFAVLCYLVERAGRLVSEQELLQAVWPRTRVETQAVRKQVFAIRKTLGDVASTPRYIETRQRRGYQFIASILPESSADRKPSPTRHNLPVQLTSFIGREGEIAELKELLLSGTRLLILTGAGGCGKTRLALQVSAGLLDAYPDGVWFVELAALAEARFVSQAVAHVFELKEQVDQDLNHRIANHLASRRALLILDNAEHLLAASALLTDLVLRRCAQLAIVVTSRERLGISGELVYRVPSLSIPDPEQEIEPAWIYSFDSARLFIERVRLHRPQFTVTPENAPAIASICQRLDGIPLAIELAAPRASSMSVQEISRRLDQRFGLLVGGSSAALPRQRTLRSLIDWSYDLLNNAEKALLCRVSVFSGGWTLEAAEHVCTGDGVDSSEVLGLLGSLVDKSLLITEEHTGATRYGLLETVRQYARDRTQEHGEQGRIQRRHLACFLKMAEKAEPHLHGPDEQACLDRLMIEHGNLCAALSWSTSVSGDPTSGLRLANALFRFWWTRGHLGLGRHWYSKLLACEPSGELSAIRGKALLRAGHLSQRQSDYTAANGLLTAGLAILRGRGDQSEIAFALLGLGLVAFKQGDLLAARIMLEECLEIHRQSGDRHGIAIALNDLGLLAKERADHPAAQALYEESLAISRELGARDASIYTLNNLGVLAYAEGNHKAARAWHKESLAVALELGSPINIAASLNNLGMVASAEGHHAAARALCRESLAIRREQGDRWGMAWTLEALAVTYSQTTPAIAARLWGCAERLREEIGTPLPAPWRLLYEQQFAAAREATGDDAAFNRAWYEGRALTQEKAIDATLNA